MHPQIIQPQRGCVRAVTAAAHGRNTFGVGKSIGRAPRVGSAELRQPWALIRKPVGLELWDGDGFSIRHFWFYATLAGFALTVKVFARSTDRRTNGKCGMRGLTPMTIYHYAPPTKRGETSTRRNPPLTPLESRLRYLFQHLPLPSSAGIFVKERRVGSGTPPE